MHWRRYTCHRDVTNVEMLEVRCRLGESEIADVITGIQEHCGIDLAARVL